MTPEALKRLDEQVKYEAEQREKKKAKQSSGFYDKPMYKSPTPSSDPLGRNLTEAEKFSKGAKGGM